MLLRCKTVSAAPVVAIAPDREVLLPAGPDAHKERAASSRLEIRVRRDYLSFSQR